MLRFGRSRPKLADEIWLVVRGRIELSTFRSVVRWWQWPTMVLGAARA
jgi:hypothetical protein